jgi:DNA-directed RNA polymerase subunit M/transcription elongation factor TFIIS
MKFCPECENRALIKVTKESGEVQVLYYCKCCGWEDSGKGDMLKDPCIYSSKLDEADTISSGVVNEYTKLDPTLPRVKTIMCPAEKCPSRVDKDNEVIYIKYDYKNMKYVYICTRCDFSWKSM